MLYQNMYYKIFYKNVVLIDKLFHSSIFLFFVMISGKF